MQAQVQAFIQAMPDLVKRAAEWTVILHSRMMNDAIAQVVFEERMRAMNAQKQDEVYKLISFASAQPYSEKVTTVAENL